MILIFVHTVLFCAVDVSKWVVISGWDIPRKDGRIFPRRIEISQDMLVENKALFKSRYMQTRNIMSKE